MGRKGVSKRKTGKVKIKSGANDGMGSVSAAVKKVESQPAMTSDVAKPARGERTSTDPKKKSRKG